MDNENNSSNRPLIVGFESQPMPKSFSTHQLLGFTVGGVLFAVYMFCWTTGISFENQVASPQKNNKVKKYTAARKEKPTQTPGQVGAYIEKYMKENNPSKLLDQFHKPRSLIDESKF